MRSLHILLVCLSAAGACLPTISRADTQTVAPVYVNPDRECTGDDCATLERPPVHCQGFDCLPPEQNPVVECQGRDCLPREQNPVIECQGQDCLPSAKICEGDDCAPSEGE
ncbi:MAG: hypothetical protein M9924_02745 [Rhizobiaceae bacterium]|nr:hypothetical protein [Rhizobiaceae bacterium]